MDAPIIDKAPQGKRTAAVVQPEKPSPKREPATSGGTVPEELPTARDALAKAAERETPAAAQQSSSAESQKPGRRLVDLGPAPDVQQSSPAESQKLSPQEVSKKAMPSVVMLLTQDAQGQPVSLGSGFFVAKNTVATNLHVLRGAAKGQVKRIGRNELYEIAGVVAVDRANDLVLLAVAESDAPPLAIETKRQVALGDRILVLGNPKGLEGTLSDGIISGIRGNDNGRLIQITAAISPGSSGGPVLNEYGEVVGVAVATVKEAQNLNFAIPSATLSILLGRVGESVPLTEVAREAEKEAKNEVPGDAPSDAVTIEHFEWKLYFAMSFSVRNKLGRAITGVRGRVVFYDGDGIPVDFVDWVYDKTIPAGLAARYDVGTNDVRFLVSILEPQPPKAQPVPETGTAPVRRSAPRPGRMEFRILDFQFADP
jgi:S1-C subfamily serine protease